MLSLSLSLSLENQYLQIRHGCINIAPNEDTFTFQLTNDL